MQKLVQAVGDDVARTIHALAESLHDEIRAVAIDDQSRQQICFGKDQPIGVGLRHYSFAMRKSLRQASQKEWAINGLTIVSEKAQGDLRGGTVMCGADDTPFRVGDSDCFA